MKKTSDEPLKMEDAPAVRPARPAREDTALLHPSAVIQPSQWRAWWSLVWLSWRRQAKARQMVWMALGLMAIAVALVAYNTATGRVGMHHWRHPRRFGFTFVQWVEVTQAVTDAIPQRPGAHAIQSAILGACRTILSPTAHDEHGRLLAISAFQIFSQWVVFSIFLTFLLPIWSLSFATEALGGERESQSLIWLLSRPLPRPAIYLAKFVALLPWSVGLNVLGFALLCLAGGPPGRLALQLYWPAVVWATLAFSALYLLMGAYFRRPAVIAIVYSFCLEVVLANMPGYLKRASIGFYTRCLMFDTAGQYGIQPEKPSVFLPVDGTTALAVLIGGTAVLLAAGMWVFSRTQYVEVD
jgi:ABC-type transport system involved in multi-copper enzyme maturation permease subunit